MATTVRGNLILIAAACLLVACVGPMPRATDPVPLILRDPLPGGGFAPELVVIPAGSFLMGSPDDEDGRYADEGPQHRVTFAQPFALGRTEVTVGEFRRFVEATGYVTGAEKWQGAFRRSAVEADWETVELNWRHDSRGEPARDELPVVFVTWSDAQAYVDWLSTTTGQRYRLPSEAEFEYANRAGSTATYWWGNGAPRAPLANLRGEHDRALADGTWEFTPLEKDYLQTGGAQPLLFAGYGDGRWWPAPVASFTANRFGVHDMTGNVWEWTADCWHDDYTGAPADGRAWAESADCESRVVRGGSYYCAPRHVRSANRWRRWAIIRTMHIGFRVARDL